MTEQNDGDEDDGLDLIEDDAAVEDISLEALDVETGSTETEDHHKMNQKLQIKKRLDSYLEKKWLKESGWDDDDELFDDEFFSDDPE